MCCHDKIMGLKDADDSNYFMILFYDSMTRCEMYIKG